MATNPIADVLVASTNFNASMQALQQPKADLDASTAAANQSVSAAQSTCDQATADAQAALQKVKDTSAADVNAKTTAYQLALTDARAKLKTLDDALLAAQITPAT